MRTATIIVLGVVLAAPAHAHCYSVWKYPYPQNCRAYAYAPVKRLARVDIRHPAPVSPAVVDIPLPELDGVFAPLLDTPAELELLQGMQRLKAIRMMGE